MPKQADWCDHNLVSNQIPKRCIEDLDVNVMEQASGKEAPDMDSESQSDKYPQPQESQNDLCDDVLDFMEC